ncbi:MAG: hypothetical protein AAGG44_03945 [Planctomycetota bacterium]
MLNAWAIWWNSQSLAGLLAPYWDAPIFWPTKSTFALSEPMLASILVAPMVKWSSLPAAYNTYLVASLMLNAWFARRFLIVAGSPKLLSTLSGCAMILHPLAWENLEAIQLAALWPSIWFWQSLCSATKPTDPWRTTLTMGLAIIASVLTCIHQALLLSVLIPLPIFVACYFAESRLTFLRTCAAAVMIAGICIGPMLLTMNGLQDAMNLQRDTAQVSLLSAQLSDWSPLPKTAWHQEPSHSARKSLAPGVLLSLMATAGLALAMIPRRGERRQHSRTPMMVMSTVILSGIVLSLGPHLTIAGEKPWFWLCDLLPPLARVRSPYRFAFFVQTAMVLQSFLVLGLLARVLYANSNSLHGTWARSCLQSLPIVAALLLTAEIVPERSQLVFPPTSANPPQWTQFLSSEVSGFAQDNAVLCLPLAANISEDAQQTETRWMLYACQHGHPIINGYSGFTPRQSARLFAQIQDACDGNTTIELPPIEGVAAIVVDKRHSNINSVQDYQKAFSDDRFDLYVQLREVMSDKEN